MGAIRRTTDKLVVHCSATKPDQDIGAADIDRWHTKNGWAGIGYHRVIRRDGTLEKGRHIDFVGAHARPWNYRSIGICLVGGVDKDGKPEDNFTPTQKKVLRAVLTEWLDEYPDAEVIGHRDVPGVKKACPSFDVKSWFKEFS